MEWIVRADPGAAGTRPVVRVTPESARWTYVGFEVYRLAPGDSLSLVTAGREAAVIVLEGTCSLNVNGARFDRVGGRTSVFDAGAPEAVYVPPGCSVTVDSDSRAEIAVASAKTDRGAGEARRITAADMPCEERGDGSTLRYIHHILDEHHPAHKLLLVEVITPSGHWSSYPPHKHDEDIPDQESYLEETYYYRIRPSQGRAMQRVYDKRKLDAVLTPGDGDLVLVPRGYHPVASPPGFTTYYLNVMSGHSRAWKYTLDDDYAHLAPSGDITGRTAPVARTPEQ